MRRARHLSSIFVLSAFACWGQIASAQATSPFTGTWFGSIVLTAPNGKTVHDTAVLVVSRGPAISGRMGRTIDQMTSWTSGIVNGSRLTFHLDAAGGLDVTLKRAGDRLAGSARGQRLQAQIDLGPASGLLPHEQLEKEILSADHELYKAFETCDVVAYSALLSPNLEFFQDHTGKTDFEQNLQALRNRCGDGIRLRRSLEEGSTIVNAVPGFGAIQAGIQSFFAMGPDGQEHIEATARFTNVWSKASGSWKLVRIISYDHH